jgi:hypothetical protein
MNMRLGGGLFWPEESGVFAMSVTAANAGCHTMQASVAYTMKRLIVERSVVHGSP